ncbi:hypothetical protein ACLOJK_019629 [Asimina triloba]
MRRGPLIEQGRQHPIGVDPAMAVHSAHLPSSTAAPFETHQPWSITPIQWQQRDLWAMQSTASELHQQVQIHGRLTQAWQNQHLHLLTEQLPSGNRLQGRKENPRATVADPAAMDG